jgi:hypothetical protein
MDVQKRQALSPVSAGDKAWTSDDAADVAQA